MTNDPSLPLPDGPPISQWDSLTVKAMLVGLVSLLASLGVKWAVSDQDVQNIATAVAFAGPGIAMIVGWIGRLRATKVIDSNLNPVAKEYNSRNP